MNRVPANRPQDETPLRSELFNAEQMEQYGRTLAGLHSLSSARVSEQLLSRLAANEGVLIAAHGLLAGAIKEGRRITPAGEWLLDNFYLIEEQIRTARRHLPKGYSRELPRLSNGPSMGLPRVYDIALETISHADGRLDPEGLRRFLASYQTVTTLKLGELWAIPIMLRLALIENLRRVSSRIAADRTDRNRADYWADQMTEIAEKDPNGLILLIADMARSDPPMVSSFVAEFSRRLQGQSSTLALPLTWMEQRLSRDGLTIDQLVQSENQQQAADQVSMSNSIGSIRLLGAMNWRDFVEDLSGVEQIFRANIAGIHGKMDFATRDRYRRAAERIAKRSASSESDVARLAIHLAEQSSARCGEDDRSAHVGYYLIDKGLPQLERAAGMRLTLLHGLSHAGTRVPLLLYAGGIVLTTAILSAGLLATLDSVNLPDWLLAFTAVLAIFCTSHFAIAFINWVASMFVRPHPLPRMDFSEGIPAECSTLVVVPTLLTSADNIESLLEALEVRYLANRGDNLHFGLLSDFADAPERVQPQDDALLKLARIGIENLNQKYRDGETHPFFLFHRPRSWDSSDNIWMGYERKRGKLAALNTLLRASENDTEKNGFELIVGDTLVLRRVKYVITLDTDTQLPREAAWQCAGAMAHPLNRPRYSQRKQRVCEGYGILQPRVAPSLPGANRSQYARMCGGEVGIDPYTRAVSDAYQDVFGEGSFIGKGIYDVDAFEQSLKGRFPENRILSHDLLEGCYARSGLLSDVQLYEIDPSLYSADVKRRRRWIRGDWQVARWLLPRVPGFDGHTLKNPLSALSRWKILDNLRRSLVPVAMTILLPLAWWRFPRPGWWTLALMAVFVAPALLTSLFEAVRRPEDILWSQHLAAVARATRRRLLQAAFGLCCLPYEAFFSLDAILRTLWRMLVARRRLLEWSPSGDEGGGSLAASVQSMWIGPAIAIAAGVFVTIARPAALYSAALLLGIWFVSPLVAWWMGRPIVPSPANLSEDQVVFLRKAARRTWTFFERFVGEEDHWLPPDNYQEHPIAVIAHRTSPTNIGLALLANLTAYDFGYIGVGELIERTSLALQSMQTMERHRGHFYNWYDTQTLKPLPPLYISTVDSGNLAGHLLTLRAGLLALPDDKIVRARLFDGIADTLTAFVDAGGPVELLELLKPLPAGAAPSLAAARERLEKLSASVDAAALGHTLAAEDEIDCWRRTLVRQCHNALHELKSLIPAGLDHIPTLREVASNPANGQPSREAQKMSRAIEDLAAQCGSFALVEYGFLFDKTRQLLAIGYHADSSRRDDSYYDLLASEARLCTFVAIAQGQLPQESWFALGRLLADAGGEPVLISWSGSMFEYLMPLLIMPTYENTLLDQTYEAAVRRQIEYGKKRGVPWGISESGYNTIDVHLNYQYRAFGVPGLGLKRGLAEDLVIAPYASAMALMVAPHPACLNLQRLAEEGREGRYGFYESIDYTPSRLQRGETCAVVRSFMAHHQGMSFLALGYVLLGRRMQKRFEADLQFQATTLLLQERIPRATAFYSNAAEFSSLRTAAPSLDAPFRVFTDPNSSVPEVQLLSNGRYHVMVTHAGGGYNRWKDLAVTRWREDATRDPWGTFCYVRDAATGEFWSTSYQPALKRPESYETSFSESRVQFRRQDEKFDTHTEISVSPEDDIELRRVKVTNRALRSRTVDVTSYAEVVLTSAAADALHPAFSNLFVQTEILLERQAIVCSRRARSVDEPVPWMFHLMAAQGGTDAHVSYETDRAQFIGRGNTVQQPRAMTEPGSLSNTAGSVLDPIVAIRYRVTLAPGESVIINMVSGVGETRQICLGLLDKYQDQRLDERVFDLAGTHSQVALRQLNITDSDAQLYERLASSVLYTNPSLRASPSILSANRRGQSGLWGHAISGDLPIVLLQIADPANIDLVHQLVQAHAYWRSKGLAVDLVIWNEDQAGYRQQLQEQILGLIAAGIESNVTDRPGGIFVRAAEQMSTEDRILLETVARAILSDKRGTLTDQIVKSRLAEGPAEPASLRPVTGRPRRSASAAAAVGPVRELLFQNGLGGFTPDGREYVITTAAGRVTPAPWVNVLANPGFGTVISESGLAYTWSENAHEFRLTPWADDPISDCDGEAYYLRDEETGEYWSPTPLPSRGKGEYVCRHGFGYTVFEHTEAGVVSELWVYVAIDAPIKFSVLKVRNNSGKPRKLSATGYAEWVLGDLRPKSTMHVTTELDSSTGALFARNPYSSEFGERVAFFDAAWSGVNDATRSVTGDRAEFIGRNGIFTAPAAMARVRLSGRTGAGLDACAAIQVSFELAAGQACEIVFTLGAGHDAADASGLVRRFRGSAASRDALQAVWQYWNHSLGAVNIETPDPSVNVLGNGWLLYQTLACRIWARSGYYQSGGAFGFRDQLQDVMAILHAEPALARQHILLSATRQFKEGDVQHWWHPPLGRGVRTDCSDDFLWLVLVTSRYVAHTGDYGILDESLSFLEGRPLSPGEDSYYDLPRRSEETASLYEHCTRAILRGLEKGEHGLPLMRTGDWNDGMNLVGERGKGESVWLAFFLCHVLAQFDQLAVSRGDIAFSRRCQTEAALLRESIEQHGWDGEWYRRAYFDDGSPLGSATNPECKIDSIPQSWSVLAGGGDRERSRLAMEAVDRLLVRRQDALIQLLDPPFDRSTLNPGYIKGYVPGVRENGGQYTHAAIWTTMAFARLGDSRRAWELFALINPVHHGSSSEQIAKYKVEPYVVAADVYAVPPHTGRGGWTWYTGSAGWMYRLIVESLLGLRIEGDKLRIEPCLPADWTGFKIHYRYRETVYHLQILQVPAGTEPTLTLDGAACSEQWIPLVDDHREHAVEMKIRQAPVVPNVQYASQRAAR
jgi:cellobiose phosphorylase